MAVYRYLAADLLTNAVLAELPLANVRFDLQLNGYGSLTGDMPLDDPLVAKINPIGSTQPGRTALYVDRDGVLLWGGIIWTRRFSNGRLSIAGAEFESYFDRRRIVADAAFAAVDQLTIAQSLINTAQAATNGNIGVTVGTETSGVVRDRTYYGADLKTVLSALQQLSSVSNGFDFAIDVAYSGNTPTKFLRLSYPRRGQVAASSGWVWEHPGNVQSYDWPEDATLQATRAFATGSGLGIGQLTASATNTSILDAGYPLLEDVHSYQDVTEQATVNAHATADVAALSSPVTIPAIQVRAEMDPMIGAYITGDELRLRITDSRFPLTSGGTAGVDVPKRILTISVTPPGQQDETVTLTLGDTV